MDVTESLTNRALPKMTNTQLTLPALNRIQKKHELYVVFMAVWITLAIISLLTMIGNNSYISSQFLPSPELVLFVASAIVSGQLHIKRKNIANQIIASIEEEEQNLRSKKSIQRLTILRTKGKDAKLTLEKFGVQSYLNQKTNLTPFQRARLVLCAKHVEKEGL